MDSALLETQLLPPLGAALEAFDEGTAEHCVRVGRNSGVVGRSLGIDGNELEALIWGGVLHDLGKLAVPKEILRKPGPLTDDEWTDIKRHPAPGAAILLALSERLAPVAVGVRSHHERWDGSGYPDGLRGEAIPLAGRIITVADVFDSLTHSRKYREHVWSVDDASAVVEDGAGAHFDPRVARSFVALFRDGRLVVPHASPQTVGSPASASPRG